MVYSANFPKILLLSAVLPVVYSALIRNSAMYGATMPHLRVITTIVPSTLRGGRMLYQPAFSRKINRQERQARED